MNTQMQESRVISVAGDTASAAIDMKSMEWKAMGLGETLRKCI